MKKNLIVKRMSTLALATVMAASPVTAFADTDITGHWAEITLTKWVDLGLLTGFPDGTVKPDNSVTRAEFVKMIQNAMGLTAKGGANFTDVSTSDWYYDAIATAVSNGVASGFPDGSFLPKATVTRAQAAMFGANLIGVTSGGSVANYTDAGSIPEWAVDAIATMTAKGYMEGLPNGSFNPNGNLTRAQAVSFLERVREGEASSTYDGVQLDAINSSTATTEEESSTSSSSSSSYGGYYGGSSSGGSSTTTPETETETETEAETVADFDALKMVLEDDTAYPYIVIPSDFNQDMGGDITIEKDVIIYVEDGAVITDLSFTIDDAEAEVEIRNLDELPMESSIMTAFSLTKPELGGLSISAGHSVISTIDIQTVSVNPTGVIETLEVVNVTNIVEVMGTVDNFASTGTVATLTIGSNAVATTLEVADVASIMIEGVVDTLVVNGTADSVLIESTAKISSVCADTGIIEDISIMKDDSSSVFLVEQNSGEIRLVATSVDLQVLSENAEITVSNMEADSVVTIDLVDGATVAITAESGTTITSSDGQGSATTVTTQTETITVDVPVTEEIVVELTTSGDAEIIFGADGETPMITVGENVETLAVDLTETSPAALAQIDVTSSTTTAVDIEVATVADVADATSTSADEKIIVTVLDGNSVTATVTTEDVSATTDAEKTGTITPLIKIATPVFVSTTEVDGIATTTLPFGTAEAKFTVSSTSTEIAIYYTTNGSVDLSEDATQGTLVSGEVTISGLTTGENVVYAIAIDSTDGGRLDSSVATLTFTVEEPNYDALDSAITTATEMTEKTVYFDITHADWLALETTLASAKAGLADGSSPFTTQSAIDDMADALDAAITTADTNAKLDRDALNTAITTATESNFGLYDQGHALWTAFVAAREEAQALCNVTTTQSDIDTATSALTSAQEALSGALMDRSALISAITTAESWVTANQAKYDKESQVWGELESLIVYANELKEDTYNTTQAIIDEFTGYLSGIEASLSGALLTYDNLTAIITEAEKIDPDDSKYQSQSAVTAFKAKLEEAQTLETTLTAIFAETDTTSDVTQSQIDAMATELELAISVLEGTALELTDLNTTITAAKVVSNEYYKYDPTNVDWLAFIDALGVAETIADHSSDDVVYTQSAVDTATATLESATTNATNALLVDTGLDSAISSAETKSTTTTNEILKAKLDDAIAVAKEIVTILAGEGEDGARTTQANIDNAIATLTSIIDEIDNATVTITNAVESDTNAVTITFIATAGENLKFLAKSSNTTPSASDFNGDATVATGSSQTITITTTSADTHVFALIGESTISEGVEIAATAALENLIVSTMKIVAVDSSTPLSTKTFDSSDTEGKDENDAYTGEGDTTTGQDDYLSDNDDVDDSYDYTDTDPSEDVKDNLYEDADNLIYVTSTTTGKTLQYKVELYNTDGVLIPTTTTFDCFGTTTDFYDQIRWYLTENDDTAVSIQNPDSWGEYQGQTVTLTTGNAGTANLIVSFTNWTGVQGGTLSEYVKITVG